MKKIFYNKLIRDKIPDIIQARGSRCSTRRLTKKVFERELVKKIGEEASGVLAARTRYEMVSELADVIYVIEELRRLKRISTRELRTAQRINQQRKGGFKKRLFLTWSSDDGYKSNESKK